MKTCSLLIGRFQPLHLGHHGIIMSMPERDSVVAIVAGAKSSLDTERNPFSVGTRERWIRTEYPEIETVVCPNAYLPDVFGQVLRETGKLVDTLYCGPDRIGEYHSKVDVINCERDEKGLPFCGIVICKRTDSGEQIRADWRAGKDISWCVLPSVLEDLKILACAESSVQL